MAVSDWIPAISSSAVLVGIGFLARNLIKSSIEKGVQHKFDRKIETLRTDLQNSTESFKSDLRAKEKEIEGLRQGALSGLASRQALLIKRRLEAVERIWSAVIDLAPAKGVAGFMSVVKFDASAEEAARNPQFRKIFEMFGKPYDVHKPPTDVAKYEKLFVSPLAWALFSAYQSVVIGAVLRAKILAIGVEDAPKFLNNEHIKNVLKAVLPHQAEYIDKNEPAAHYHLLEEIEQNLLSELRRMLEGADIDEKSVGQAAQIMEAVDVFEAKRLADSGISGRSV